MVEHFDPSYIILGVANGKFETHRDTETGILKSEPETKKCTDLIEKHICDRQTQNLRLKDPLESSARFWTRLGWNLPRLSIFGGPFTTPNVFAAGSGIFNCAMMHKDVYFK